MARVIKYTKAFKKQFKKRRQDPKWRSIFKSSLPQEFDDQKRSPWKYIIQCLIEDKTIPDYFYPHALEGVTMEKQETTRKKKRFDMKRSFRRISAVIATMAEDSSVIMRREVVYSSAGLYGLESFGTSSSEYKQFVDTFRLSEDTQE